MELARGVWPLPKLITKEISMMYAAAARALMNGFFVIDINTALFIIVLNRFAY